MESAPARLRKTWAAFLRGMKKLLVDTPKNLWEMIVATKKFVVWTARELAEQIEKREVRELSEDTRQALAKHFEEWFDVMKTKSVVIHDVVLPVAERLGKDGAILMMSKEQKCLHFLIWAGDATQKAEKAVAGMLVRWETDLLFMPMLVLINSLTPENVKEVLDTVPEEIKKKINAMFHDKAEQQNKKLVKETMDPIMGEMHFMCLDPPTPHPTPPPQSISTVTLLPGDKVTFIVQAKKHADWDDCLAHGPHLPS